MLPQHVHQLPNPLLILPLEINVQGPSVACMINANFLTLII